MILRYHGPRFALGQVLCTANARQTVPHRCMMQSLSRHVQSDWGDVCSDDRKANEDALDQGERLLSVYHDRHGVRFWIITEADRSVTTVLLPEDY